MTPLGGSDLNAQILVVAVNTRGDAVAAWIGDGQVGASVVQAATHPLGGRWQTTALSPSGDKVSDPEAAVIDQQGDASVLWVDDKSDSRTDGGSSNWPAAASGAAVWR